MIIIDEVSCYKRIICSVKTKRKKKKKKKTKNNKMNETDNNIVKFK